MITSRFYQLVNSHWRMRLFLLWKLPAAWFMGIGVRSCDAEQCQVILPYGWCSQNPFRSIYFAAQCAAAELSTGLLALAALQGKPPVSMLVTDIEAHFLKKAADTLVFTCRQGQEVAKAVDLAVQNGDVQVLTMISEGRLPDGQVAAQVKITWSFKRKTRPTNQPQSVNA